MSFYATRSKPPMTAITEADATLPAPASRPYLKAIKLDVSTNFLLRSDTVGLRVAGMNRSFGYFFSYVAQPF